MISNYWFDLNWTFLIESSFCEKTIADLDSPFIIFGKNIKEIEKEPIIERLFKDEPSHYNAWSGFLQCFFGDWVQDKCNLYSDMT